MLAELVSEIKREGKIPVEGLLMTLVDGVEKSSDPMCIYKDIYKKAYGEHLSEKICREWVSHMTEGEHWTYEQTTEVGNKAGINWNYMTKWEWYCALNGAYSDFYNVAKMYQVEDDPDYFAETAKAFWCNDEDVKHKTIFSYYFNYVA